MLEVLISLLIFSVTLLGFQKTLCKVLRAEEAKTGVSPHYRLKSSRGNTLLEAVISLAIASALLLGMTSVLVHALRLNAISQARFRLNRSMETTFDTVEHLILQAGYCDTFTLPRTLSKKRNPLKLTQLTLTAHTLSTHYADPRAASLLLEAEKGSHDLVSSTPPSFKVTDTLLIVDSQHAERVKPDAIKRLPGSYVIQTREPLKYHYGINARIRVFHSTTLSLSKTGCHLLWRSEKGDTQLVTAPVCDLRFTEPLPNVICAKVTVSESFFKQQIVRQRCYPLP